MNPDPANQVISGRALSRFLLDRIAETQAEALELGRLRYTTRVTRSARARLLATEGAHRRIVKAAADYSPELAEGDNGEGAFDEVLRILASAYSDHPDYRDEWRP